MTNLLDLVRRMVEGAGGTAPAWGILLRVTVLLLVATLVALALRRSSAALRHLVWTLSLAGTLLIPLCYSALPAWHWAILPESQPEPSAAPLAPVTKVAPASGPSIAPLAERGGRNPAQFGPFSAFFHDTGGPAFPGPSDSIAAAGRCRPPGTGPVAPTEMVLAGSLCRPLGSWAPSWALYGLASASRRRGM